MHDLAHTVGLLLSGGLDSTILLWHLRREGYRVQPFYVRSEVAWVREELQAVERLLQAVRANRAGSQESIAELVVLDLPLHDLYGNHWSLSGQNVPDAASRDDAVYLPGRNALLLLKPAIWCQMRGIRQLALGMLASNPFGDATAEFCECFAALIQQSIGGKFEVLRPFATMQKREVMLLGTDLPLELTFSCIAPVGGLHCGRCNKCAERRAAFVLVNRRDPTTYAEK